MGNKRSYFNKFHDFFQTVSQLAFKVYCPLKYKIVVEGRENIPPEAAFIVVSNHQSYGDIPLICHTFGGNHAFIAKQELFSMPFLGLWLKLTGTISVNRNKPESSVVKKAKEAILRKNWKVAIFIEGTRSKIEGHMGEPNTGAVYISKLTKAKIVPVGIQYKKDREVLIRIGEAYTPNIEQNLEDQSWVCLEKISKLASMEMPPRNKVQAN
jgi:1-acyl-sn-glycerol-3-phosphate acyltransferase